MVYDVIIVGGGPAGLSAGLNCRILGLRALILESCSIGGLLVQVYPWKEVGDCLGFGKLRAAELAKRFREHTTSLNLEIRENERVIGIKRTKGKALKAITAHRRYLGKAIVLAIGVFGSPRRLGIAGEELGGVYYVLSDPKRFRGKRVVVVGGGDSAVESATWLRKAGADVTIIHRREQFRAAEGYINEMKKSGVKMILNSEIRRISGKERAAEVKIIDKRTGQERGVKIDALLIQIGMVSNVELLKKIGLELDGSHVRVNGDLRTNIEGIFAAGDITGGIRKIPAAIAQGQKAAYSVYSYLKRPYWA